MLRYFFLTVLLLAVAVVSIAGFRGQKTPYRPIQIFPDMKHQPRIDAQHESKFFADGRSIRRPVQGTVPLGYTIPGSFEQNSASNNPLVQEHKFSNLTDYYDTGKIGEVYGDGIPLENVSDALLARGKERFGIHCAACHGYAGYGNGVVASFGLVGVANFHQDRLRTMPDGQIFNTITNGKNTMAAYGPNIAVEDRWAIIAYIRALQKSQNATLAEMGNVAGAPAQESKK